MTAADLVQSRQHLLQQVGGLLDAPDRMRDQRVGSRDRHLLPHHLLHRLHLAGVLGETGQQPGGLLAAAGTGQPIEVVEVEERVDVLVGAGREIVGDIGPAVADIDAAEREAGQERHSVDLILGILLQAPPDVGVVDLERTRVVVAIQVEQRHMPPVVRIHEGVAVLPGIGEAFHPGETLVHPALSLHHMGDGMVGPGISAIHLHRPASGGLGFLEAVALFVAEGDHAVDEMVLRTGREHALAER